ncbi:helix-turn-helix domain-containing protein [Burkholderia ubonensis]|uniref:helix-turn-helix domain-containing protein n=1 Tax=Burkholderia ubonensis TaxID=101571 RepID=UPI0009B390D2|nr:helix-turn-helix transcriptional regulator [Burkholderia ubonensis]
MAFSNRLSTLRKQRGLTQQQLADRAEVHMVQINRYEAGLSRPTLDVFKRLAISLSVSADTLLFNDSDYRPDEEFRPLFDGLRDLTDREKTVVKSVLEAILLKHRMSGEDPVAQAIGRIVSLNKRTRREDGTK